MYTWKWLYGKYCGLGYNDARRVTLGWPYGGQGAGGSGGICYKDAESLATLPETTLMVAATQLLHLLYY